MTMLAELSAGPWVATAEMGTMLPGSPKICVRGVKGKMLSPLLVGGGGGDPAVHPPPPSALPAMVPRPSLL